MFNFIGNGYQLVAVSLIFSTSLMLSIYFYRYIYPKREINYLILLLLFSLLPIVSAFRPGLYESGDFNIHIYRSIEFYRSLSEGNVMPSWAGELNATYGYPLFIFNYTLPYYIVCFFHFLGFSFELSMKLFLFLNFLFSAFFMYIASKKLFKSEIAAFVSSIFYQFAPYYLADLNFKVAFGEIMIFTLFPLILFLIQKMWEKKNLLFLSISALSGSFLIMSHSLTAFLIFGLFLTYSLFLSLTRKDKYFFFSTLLAFILSSFSSLYLWLGPLIMNQFTLTTKMSVGMNTLGMDLFELVYSPWRFGLLFQGPIGEINTPIGYSHIFIVLVLVFLLIKKKISSKNKYQLIFWLTAFISVTFLATVYSSFIWSQIKIPILLTLPERMPILFVFILAILAGYFALNFQKKKAFLWTIIIFTIFSTILNWGHRRVISTMNDQNLIINLPKSTYEAEAHWYANSKWRKVSDQWFKDIPRTHIEILEGDGETKDIERKSTVHTYIIVAKSDIKIIENTLYFPGWQVKVDRNYVLAKPNKDGIITFNLPKGLHLIKVEYSDFSNLRNIKIISCIFTAGLILSIIVGFFKRK